MSDLIKYILITKYTYKHKIAPGLLKRPLGQSRLALIGGATFPFLEEHYKKFIAFQKRFEVFSIGLNSELNQN